MNPLEQQVWAAAFAAAWIREYDFRRTNPGDHLTIRGISGFSCGELADEALLKFREALACDDGKYLTPMEESWT